MQSAIALGSAAVVRRLPADSWRMPDESAPHERTWCAFVADPDIWPNRQTNAVKDDLAALITTIAQYEAVTVLVNARDLALARKKIGSGHRHRISFITAEIDDLWLRDTAAVFTVNGTGGLRGIDFNFNGWGNKQRHAKDSKIAALVCRAAQAQMVKAGIILEGGGFEVDGQGTAIATESCILNDNRNPEVSKSQAENEMKRLLGLQKIIWLQGAKGKDITDAHTDFYARFAYPETVVVHRDNDPKSHDYALTRENIAVLQKATDARGNPLKLVILDAPRIVNDRYGSRDFAAGYVGFYCCNNAVIMQKFGDLHADQSARDKIRKLFPDRHIEQIAVDAIAAGGGSIHCATQQQPLA